MEPYIGQIEAFAFGIVPRGWAPCAGQTLAIATNQALFALLGTTYGGDGVTNFRLPDLRGRSSMGMGAGPNLPPAIQGTLSGEAVHTLTIQETPPHLHQLMAVNNGTSNGTNIPGPSVMLGSANTQGASPVQVAVYSSTAPSLAMVPTGSTGGQPHENMMPFQAINYCIALVGTFPPRD